MTKLNEQMKAHDGMYKRLKSMRVQSINKEPDWPDCVNSTAVDYDKDKEAMFHNLAGHMVHKNKIPLEIAKFGNTIFVRTENQNA